MTVIEGVAAANAATVATSPMWDSTTAAIRFTNFISPLLLGIISQPGSQADATQRRKELDFLVNSTNAATEALMPMLEKMSEVISRSKKDAKYDREELQDVMVHFLGSIWEKNPDRAHEAVTAFVESLTQAVTDPEFAHRHAKTAKRMVEGEIGVFKPTDTPETMTNRIAMSMQLATVRMHEAAIDRRLENPVSGALFQWGRQKGEVANALTQRFDRAMRSVMEARQLSAALSNNQRASLIQTYIRHASNVMTAEYVARSRAMVRWVREVKESDPVEWRRRIATVDATFPKIVEEIGAQTEQTLFDLLPADLIEEEQEQSESSAPSA